MLRPPRQIAALTINQSSKSYEKDARRGDCPATLNERFQRQSAAERLSRTERLYLDNIWQKCDTWRGNYHNFRVS